MQRIETARRSGARGAALAAALAVAGVAAVGASAAPPAMVAPLQDCADCPAMIALPAGRFEMGSSDLERRYYGVPAPLGRREAPRHPVTIVRPFAIARTEITRDQYARFVRATGRPDDTKGCSVLDRRRDVWEDRRGFSWHHPGVASSGRHPVTCVSWNDATAYAAWLSKVSGHRYRLPSEAEWEYAARGGTTTAAYWGDSAEAMCAAANVMNAASFAAMGRPPSWRDRLMCSGTTAWVRPVASYRPNPFGLYDMIGNVWEWAQDCAAPDYAATPVDGSAFDTPGCTTRAIRGGAFHSAPYFGRAASRGYGKPADHVSVAIGFRLVREPA